MPDLTHGARVRGCLHVDGQIRNGEATRFTSCSPVFHLYACALQRESVCTSLLQLVARLDTAGPHDSLRGLGERGVGCDPARIRNVPAPLAKSDLNWPLSVVTENSNIILQIIKFTRHIHEFTGMFLQTYEHLGNSPNHFS